MASAIRKTHKSSRDRNDNQRIGWSQSCLSGRLHARLVKDVKAGILPKSCLKVTISLGQVGNGLSFNEKQRRGSDNKPVARLVQKVKGLFTRKSGSRGSSSG